jgi:hypothetical protein
MSELTFDDYQTAAASTAIYPEAGEGSFNALSYAILGLTNEAGEVAGKLKKVWRDKGGVLDDEAKAGIADELGRCFLVHRRCGHRAWFRFGGNRRRQPGEAF